MRLARVTAGSDPTSFSAETPRTAQGTRAVSKVTLLNWSKQVTNLFHALANDVANCSNRPSLPNTMHSIQCLLLSHGVPLRLHEMHFAGCSQVDASESSALDLDVGNRWKSLTRLQHYQ